ncbi:hypothetical protein C4546_03595 [Candidatus Parcubacteria bacterium]|jgi:pyruvate,water dikinase|nr:MAG: hypothetical protein C4546_03595 [Candidatus Parcubacteria bacterium]
MMFIRDFTALSKKDTSIAGGKGASLGEMTQVGIPVPPGFVILAQAFEAFEQEAKLDKKIPKLLQAVKPTNPKSLDLAAKRISKLILSSKMSMVLTAQILAGFKKLRSAQVAVRSSATAEDSSSASWAGELESYLNVTQKDLLASVKKCWASLFTPRAIFYRFEKRLNRSKVSVAVVVQKMIQSEVSGIAFTVHPVSKNRRQMVIESGYGLGEAVVGGRITPDTHVVEKRQLRIVDKNISSQNLMIVRASKGNLEKVVPANLRNKQKIQDKQILELARLCLQIEKHYHKPQDIEWAYEKRKFFVVQSRPITTL